MTPGIPSDSEVPDDAGIESGAERAVRRHGVLAWGLVLVVVGLGILLVTGTLGASLVTEDAELGPPQLLTEIDGTPYVVVQAGEYAVGVVVTESASDVLFGPTERPLPPPEGE